MIELYIFSTILALFLALGLNVVISQNPVYSILYLVLFFITGASMLALFGFDYLSLIFVLVYVGAIAVLFLFVVMILDIKILNKVGFNANFLILIALLLFFLPIIFYALTILLTFQNNCFETLIDTTTIDLKWLYSVDYILLINESVNYSLIDKEFTLNLQCFVNNFLKYLEKFYLESYLYLINVIGFYDFLILLRFYFCEYGFTAPDFTILLYDSNYLFKVDYESSVKNFQVIYTDFMALFILCGGVLLVAMTSCISLALPSRRQIFDRPIHRSFKTE